MVCLTGFFSKQLRNFNCPAFQIFIDSVHWGGGGGGDLSISYLKPRCLSYGEGLSQTTRFMHEEKNLSWKPATPETLKQIMQICNVKRTASLNI